MIEPSAREKSACCNTGTNTIANRDQTGQSGLPCMTSILDHKLRRAQLLVFQDFIETFSTSRLRPAEFSVLAMIANHPGQKQTTIAEELGIKRANFVALMDSLEARGFAERRKGENDRRSHSLYLTEAGEEFVSHMCKLWNEHEERMLERLGGEENRDQLVMLLDRLLVGSGADRSTAEASGLIRNSH
ncbi:MarR family winged helix-turn-helix transcriptional regulator [Nitratireductor basaltis]|uniref:Transcriptional regulator MarR family protein n=1 Tax=Nitratireductor basaltis TaxID=472175 RepID=A0A084U877_9HYPH|nr:MarR family winged helix-turn-helix transcriptional regulator [Nitratireductor basaltis]KFB09163.1 Transcriptional regulator MarR family protein [Nitratireductor basaltis]